MIRVARVVGFFAALGALAFGIAGYAQQPPREVEMFRLELVTRLDAVIERGPFDTAGPVDRRLVKDVRNCVDAVRKEAMDWAAREQLVVSREDCRESSLVLLFEPPKQRGVFEIVYRVDVSRGYATGAFKYYDPTGAPLSEPTSAHREFGERLRKAMLCQ